VSETQKENSMTTRRQFITNSRRRCGAAAERSPHRRAIKRRKIKWRMQTYAGARWASTSPSPWSTTFNKAANGEMEIELFFADQIVPTGELFRAMQRGHHRRGAFG
jgi:TRAP-type mannitol/chloroaromatic compound transport system substrate-binding protein